MQICQKQKLVKDRENKRQNQLLKTKHKDKFKIYVKHTSINIGSAFKNALIRQSLEFLLSLDTPITSDNAANVVKALTLLTNKDIGCFLHRLSTVIGLCFGKKTLLGKQYK